jgi:hypothetical protein
MLPLAMAPLGMIAVLLSGVSSTVVKIWISFTLPNMSLCVDQVAHLVGFEKQDERASGEVGQRALQARPIAKPAAPMMAMKLVVCTPSMPMKVISNRTFKRDGEQTVQEALQRGFHTPAAQHPAQHAWPPWRSAGNRSKAPEAQPAAWVRFHRQVLGAHGPEFSLGQLYFHVVHGSGFRELDPMGSTKRK